jgi:hypothetical protein
MNDFNSLSSQLMYIFKRIKYYRQMYFSTPNPWEHPSASISL